MAKSKKVIGWVLVGLLALSGGAGLLAQSEAGGEAVARGRRFGDRAAGRSSRAFWTSPRMVERLELTPEQVADLEAAEAEGAAERAEVDAEWREVRTELTEALAAESISPERIRDLGRSLARLTAERSELDTERQLALRRILTAEQWAQIRTRGGREAGEEMGRSGRWGGEEGRSRPSRRGGPPTRE